MAHSVNHLHHRSLGCILLSTFLSLSAGLYSKDDLETVRLSPEVHAESLKKEQPIYLKSRVPEQLITHIAIMDPKNYQALPALRLETGRLRGGEGDIIEITPQESAALGSMLSIWRENVPIMENKCDGIQAYLVTKIAEAVQLQDNLPFYKIRKVFREVRGGDKVSPWRNGGANIAATKAPQPLYGQILHFMDGLSVAASGQVAIINQGREMGIKPGMEFTLVPATERRRYPSPLGKAIIFDTSDKSSLAYIYKAESTIAIKDWLISPQIPGYQ